MNYVGTYPISQYHADTVWVFVSDQIAFVFIQISIFILVLNKNLPESRGVHCMMGFAPETSQTRRVNWHAVTMQTATKATASKKLERANQTCTFLPVAARSTASNKNQDQKRQEAKQQRSSSLVLLVVQEVALLVC
jgi:hypothetical protein